MSNADLERRIDDVEMRVKEWGALICSFVLMVMYVLLGNTAETLAGYTFAGLILLFAILCLSVSFAYARDGYNRRFWELIGFDMDSGDSA